jgi:molybdopterin-containing oxidoreductase family iron-sulfur binding subunit
VTTGRRRHLPLAPTEADLPASTDRREWLKQIAAGVALAGLAGCTRKRGEHILPYPRPPRHATPGIPRTYATSLSLDGFATGVLVESHDGRPTKIEGNPDHPASLGATSAFEQAAVLGLYDPSRARALRSPGHAAATWEIFRERFGAARADGGAGLRFLLGPTGSPLAGDLVDRIRARFPAARFTFCSTGDGASVAEGARIAFGAPAQPVHDFGHADVILSIGHDFLGCGPFTLRYARQWSARRRPASPAAEMSRLYVIETMPTPTGTVADHRLRRKPGAVALTAAHIAAEIAAGPAGKRLPAPLAAALSHLRGDTDPRVHAVATDLARAAGRCVITVGPEQPAVVHALGHLLSQMLSTPEATWTIAPTRIGAGEAQQDLPALAEEMDRGAVDTLVVIEQNAAYSAPADLDLGRRLAQVRDVVYVGEHEDETAAHAGWFVPAAHALESWGDATAYDGTASIVQPLIDPLYGGRTATEILALFAGDLDPDARHLVRARWNRQNPGAPGETRWADALRTGIVAGTASPRQPPSALAVGSLVAALESVKAPAAGLELAFALDPSVHDGRFANNA